MNPHQRYLVEEFAEDYRERRMSRRDLLRRVLLITGSIPATASILVALGCGGDDDDGNRTPQPQGTDDPTAPASTPTSPAAAPGGPTTAPGVTTSDVRFKGPASDILGYLALPPVGVAQKVPGILVIHENRGLVDHTKDIARRFAGEGFVALAIDLVSRNGGSSADAAQNTGFLGSANPADLVADLQAGVDYLNTQERVRPSVIGVTGFCFGGGYAFEIAISSPGVRAAVPFYGTVARMEELGQTKAAILAIYGGNDTRVTSQAETVRARLAASGRPFEIKVYDGADHAFFNDTGNRYNPTAAADAWTRMLAWFRQHLTA